VDRLAVELEAEIVERQAEASERRVALTKIVAKLADERGKLVQTAKGELEATAGRTFSELLYIKDRRIGRAEFSDVFAPLFSRPSSNKG
jgi:hypothetical protein